MITIDLRKRQLIYEQIVENVKLQIIRGVLCENDYMPSVRSLANELGINPNTIQKAYAELERQGIIQSVAGKGSIIVANAAVVNSMQNDHVTEQIRQIAKIVLEAGFDLEQFCDAAKSVFSCKEDENDRDKKYN
ncbi:MAG: GntR family transcriptional regulator [Ruminococcaceae bacterium]|nr:GntR family transcriptional regulator [Oscillospiraceae bacterium]